MLVSASVIALSSLAGALTIPLSYLGRTSPSSISAEWLMLLAGSWVILAGWALCYAILLRRQVGLASERALYWAAVCHTPLLLCLGLVAALYTSDVGHHLYLSTPYGPFLSQPLTKLYVLVTPATAQLLRFSIRNRASLIGTLALLLVAGGAFVLRAWHLEWGLPGMFHPDEYSGTLARRMMATGDMNPHFFKNPSTMVYLAYFVQVIAAQHVSTFHTAVDLVGLSLQDPRGDYLLLLSARAVSAAAGTMTVVVLYFGGKEILGRRVALIAASLLAVTFLHVRNSHYATNDVLATLLLTASYSFAARIFIRGRGSDYLLAALFGGLAASTKYTSVLFVLPILVAHLSRGPAIGSRLSLRYNLPLAASVPTSLLAFLAGTPYAILDFSKFREDFLFQLALGAEHARGQDFLPTSLLIIRDLTQGFGWVPLLLALVGALLLARNDLWRFAFVISIPVALFVSLSKQSYYFARFIVPLLPFLSLCSAYCLDRMACRWESLKRGRSLLALLIAVAFAQPLALSIRHDALLGEADTRILAAQWIATHTPLYATVAVETHSLMDNPYGWRGTPERAPSSYWHRDITVFWPERDEEMRRVLAGNYDYVVVTSWGYESLQGDDPSLADMPDKYQQLDAVGRLVAQFGPGYRNTDVPYAVDDGYTPFWHLFDRERPGPTVKVYQTQPLSTHTSPLP